MHAFTNTMDALIIGCMLCHKTHFAKAASHEPSFREGNFPSQTVEQRGTRTREKMHMAKVCESTQVFNDAADFIEQEMATAHLETMNANVGTWIFEWMQDGGKCKNTNPSCMTLIQRRKEASYSKCNQSNGCWKCLLNHSLAAR